MLGKVVLDRETQQQILLQHLRQLHSFYGDYTGLRVARKHVGWYLQEHNNSLGFRREFNRIENGAQQLRAVDQFFQTKQYEELAA